MAGSELTTFKAKCRGCPRTVVPGYPCDHLRLTEDGRAFEVHSQHQEEPAQYVSVEACTEEEAREVQFGKEGPLEKALRAKKSGSDQAVSPKI